MPLGPLPLASLVVKPPPLQVANWYEYLETFLQDGGVFALLGLWLALLWPFARAMSEGGRGAKVQISFPLVALAVLAPGLYIAAFSVSAIAEYRPPAVAPSTQTPNL